MTYLAHNLENFTFNNSLHGICPRRRLQLHRPAANIVSYLKVVHYTTTKVFNILPKCAADWMVDKQQFVQSLRNRLIERSFNFTDEFFDYCVTSMQWLLWIMHHILYTMLRLIDECIIFCVYCLMNVFCTLLWHDCFELWCMTGFTSRAFGQTDGSGNVR
jgi:hypothetical protein